MQSFDKNSSPSHVAIVMDGNGRWAKKYHLPRVAGHREGLKALRRIIEAVLERGIATLTVFAFSSENWSRPVSEVEDLLALFARGLEKELPTLMRQGISLRVIGDLSGFEEKLRLRIEKAENLTKENQNLTLNIAANYGGRWDILQATRKIADQVMQGLLSPKDIKPEIFNTFLSTHANGDPELLIRTSGEQRISNFLLWQIAYTELYFCEKYWPDFNASDLDNALDWFSRRERRFGG